jgi:hypothetical protein
MTKIIFLDIDGVLNGHEWCHTKEGPRIFPEPARYLHILLQRSGAKVVLISSWRSWIVRGFMTPKGFSRVLLSHGCEANVIDALGAKDPNKNHRDDRREKILQWIEENKPDRYVILDDLPLDLPNLIRPNPAIGLQPVHISNAMEMLE